jgi:hypothetical protein
MDRAVGYGRRWATKYKPKPTHLTQTKPDALNRLTRFDPPDYQRICWAERVGPVEQNLSSATFHFQLKSQDLHHLQHSSPSQT